MESSRGSFSKENLVDETASRMHGAWQEAYITAQHANNAPDHRFKDPGEDLEVTWSGKILKTFLDGNETILEGRGLKGRIIGGKQEVDIAHTAYRNLPGKWQQENKAAAEHAVELLVRALNRFPPEELEKTLSEFMEDKDASNQDALTFLKEEAGPAIHNAWLERNAYAKKEGGPLNVPFLDLAPFEQKKDLQILKTALEVYLT